MAGDGPIPTPGTGCSPLPANHSGGGLPQEPAGPRSSLSRPLLLLPLGDDPTPRQGLAMLASGCAVLAIVSGCFGDHSGPTSGSLLVWLAIIPGLLWVSLSRATLLLRASS